MDHKMTRIQYALATAYIAACTVALMLMQRSRFSALSSTTTASTLAVGVPTSFSSAAAAAPTSSRRVVLGIFTTDALVEQQCRNKYRQLFALHPHVCDLSTYTKEKPADCRLVYSFVLGGNPNATTFLTDNSRPYLVDAENQMANYTSTDMSHGDMTLLNIRENKDDGKSPTWLAYAASLARQHAFDYVAKQDIDTILYLERYFAFVDASLPPAPYNRNILAAAMHSKASWYPKFDITAPKEAWVYRKYGNYIHIYAEGPWYILSPDLAELVQQEYMTDEYQSYQESHEAHDISAMAFQASQKLIMIALDQKHWRHPVKYSMRSVWNIIWEGELFRLKRIMQDTLLKAKEA